MSEYLPKLKSLAASVKVELNLSNYATKADLENKTGVDTSDFDNKTDLSHLKSDVDKLDIDRLKNVLINFSYLKSKVDQLDVDKLVSAPIYLSKLSHVVKNDAFKWDVYLLNKIYIMLRSKILQIKYCDIPNLATNTTLNAKINEVENKIPSITNLATTAALNVKIKKIKSKIPNIINLATSTPLTTVENKIPDHNKYITNVENVAECKIS